MKRMKQWMLSALLLGGPALGWLIVLTLFLNVFIMLPLAFGIATVLVGGCVLTILRMFGESSLFEFGMGSLLGLVIFSCLIPVARQAHQKYQKQQWIQRNITR
jgi:hypothetical protein